MEPLIRECLVHECPLDYDSSVDIWFCPVCEQEAKEEATQRSIEDE